MYIYKIYIDRQISPFTLQNTYRIRSTKDKLILTLFPVLNIVNTVAIGMMGCVYIFIYLLSMFGATPNRAQDLWLCASGITPGFAQGTIWDTQDRTQVSHIQGKPLTSVILLWTGVYIFLSFFLHFLHKAARNGVAGPDGRSIFTFEENLDTVSHSVCSSLH